MPDSNQAGLELNEVLVKSGKEESPEDLAALGLKRDEEGKIYFVGLTKEQLEPFENDPLWKKIRHAFFALFWITWLAMLVAALVIIFTSPRCPDKPLLEWYQDSSFYEINLDKFYAVNKDPSATSLTVDDFAQGLLDKIGYIKKDLGFNAVILHVDKNHQSEMQKFQSFYKRFRDNKIKLILKVSEDSQLTSQILKYFDGFLYKVADDDKDWKNVEEMRSKIRDQNNKKTNKVLILENPNDFNVDKYTEFENKTQSLTQDGFMVLHRLPVGIDLKTIASISLETTLLQESWEGGKAPRIWRAWALSGLEREKHFIDGMKDSQFKSYFAWLFLGLQGVPVVQYGDELRHTGPYSYMVWEKNVGGFCSPDLVKSVKNASCELAMKDSVNFDESAYKAVSYELALVHDIKDWNDMLSARSSDRRESLAWGESEAVAPDDRDLAIVVRTSNFFSSFVLLTNVGERNSEFSWTLAKKNERIPRNGSIIWSSEPAPSAKQENGRIMLSPIHLNKDETYLVDLHCLKGCTD